ncbi:hypothetical protein ANTQUA_LOCUS8950 [Anthophora quadrimaculata]
MATLGEIPHICDNTRKATTKSIRKLYKFITERNDDRNSRKYLRAFRGFNFDADSEEYRKEATEQVEELVTRISENVADTNLLRAASETNILEIEEESEDGILNNTIRPFQIHSRRPQAPSRTMSPTNSAVTQNPFRAQELPKFVLNFRNSDQTI